MGSNSFGNLNVPYKSNTGFADRMAAPKMKDMWSMGGMKNPSSSVMNGMNTQANDAMSGLDLDFSYQPDVPGGAGINNYSNQLNAGTADMGGNGGGMDFLGPDGWGSLALGGIQTGLGAYMGFKQLGAAKDQLNFQKESFNKNYEASKQTTNTQLADRQKRRYAENPDHYKSESEYMKTNGIK
jgi:hypothetical protein